MTMKLLIPSNSGELEAGNGKIINKLVNKHL